MKKPPSKTIPYACVVLLSGMTASIGLASESKSEVSPGQNILRLDADRFTAQLPWFYHGLPFETPQQHDIHSFEVNGLELTPGDYTVSLVPQEGVDLLETSLDGKTFHTKSPNKGRVELAGVSIRNRMLGFYVKSAGPKTGNPLAFVLIHPETVPFEQARKSAVPYAPYRRDIQADRRAILQKDNWPEFYRILKREGFGKKQLRAMFDDILYWCMRRQVLDPEDLHYGAIYSEEDKYDFRDAAAASVCFMHAWRDTGKEEYRRRATLARNYVYKGQHMADPSNKEQYGGFCQMTHGEWGRGMQRLRPDGKLPNTTGVETCICINLLVKTFELGLAPEARDIEHLRAAGTWVANSEFKPGVFRHHQGAPQDCQASNALAVMGLARAYSALDALGEKPPEAWVEAARRGMAHYLEGQEAIGSFPYHFAKIGRGQAFTQANLPDHGMGFYHFMVACETPVFRDTPEATEAMKRMARWWLCMSRIDRREPKPTIDLDDRGAGGALKFSAFTWCRFMAAASLMRIAEMTEEKAPWQSLALRYMEHVHEKLWNTTDPERAPVNRATRDDMTLCSWIQTAEWDAVLLREIEERCDAPTADAGGHAK